MILGYARRPVSVEPSLGGAPARGARPAAYDPPRALVDRARQGDPAAVADLVRGLLPHVMRAVSALLGPQHPDVEDVAQEVVLAVIDALPSFRGDSTLLHFAVRITTRRATRARRRSRSILGWLERLHRTEHPLSTPPPTPLATTVAERRRDLLRRLLADLPESQADVMLLRIALGCSLEDVAAVTGAPVNTVRSRLRLAKEALRRKIERDPCSAELLAPGEEP
jgi:RNA polymerase sigma factor (sigma-70 family)